MRNILKTDSTHDKNIRFLFYLVYLMNCIILFVPKFENDTYWLISTGKYILNNGFPRYDPFTIHSDLPIIVQQWVSAIIFNLLNVLAPLALYCFCIAVYFFIVITIFKIAMLLSENNFIVSFATALGAQIFLNSFIVVRPQILSLLIFVSYIYILEIYVETQNASFLTYVPFLSVLLINVHSALWFFLFILMIPYIIEGLNLEKIGTVGYGARKLILVTVISFFAGILNPYGIYNMFYVLFSYGDMFIKNNIDEMKSPDFKLISGVILFILIMIMYFIRTRSKEHTVIRYTLLSLGTLFLGLSSKRSLCMFYIIAFPVMAYYLKGIRIVNKSPNKKLKIVTMALLFVMVLFNFIIKYYRNDLFSREFAPQQIVSYLKNNFKTDQLIVFNGFNIGGFLGYNGFKPYIDSRAELFTKKYNGQKDILKEYIDVITGKLHYEDIIKEYNFNCFIVIKEELLDTYLRRDENFQYSFSDGYFNIYIDKRLIEQ